MLNYILRQPMILWEGDGGSGGSGGAATTDSSKDPANPAVSSSSTATGDGDGTQQQQDKNDDDPVEKAYGKLRAAEKERDDLRKTLRDIERNKLPEGERLKAENEELKGKIADLSGKLSEVTTSTAVTAEARELGFTKPERALKALQVYRDVDITKLDSEEAIQKELKELLKDEPQLATTPPPSGGPVNQGDKTPAGSAGFNQTIRAAAGHR